eukprot:1146552-Pelagomonas_calceolata.AAC.1
MGCGLSHFTHLASCRAIKRAGAWLGGGQGWATVGVEGHQLIVARAGGGGPAERSRLLKAETRRRGRGKGEGLQSERGGHRGGRDEFETRKCIQLSAGVCSAHYL